jgi:hypothetical protein
LGSAKQPLVGVDKRNDVWRARSCIGTGVGGRIRTRTRTRTRIYFSHSQRRRAGAHGSNCRCAQPTRESGA